MTPGKLSNFSKIKQAFSSGKKDGSNNVYKGFPGGSAVKNLPAMQEPQETRVLSLGQKDPLEDGLATHSSILA